MLTAKENRLGTRALLSVNCEQSKVIFEYQADAPTGMMVRASRKIRFRQEGEKCLGRI